MLNPRCCFAAAIVVGLLAGELNASQNWMGAQILPNSAQVAIQDDNGSAVSVYDIAWPATVVKTRGRELYIQDDGGYSPAQAGGWIYSDDAVRLESARDHFTSQLRKNLSGVGGSGSNEFGRSETAWLYWMRGISWESAGDSGVAIVDYKHALRSASANTRLDDLYIRLGRLMAKRELLDGRGKYDKQNRNKWEWYFEQAEKWNPNRPQLYYEWGFALSQACSCTQAKLAGAAKNAESVSKPPANETKPQPDQQSPKTYKQSAPKPPKANGPKSNAAKSGDLTANALPSVAGQALADNLPTPPALTIARPQFRTVGVDVNDDAQGGRAQSHAPLKKMAPAEESPKTAAPVSLPPPAPVSPPVVALPANDAVVGPPSPDGADAAFEALGKYKQAEKLSPNWWRLPLARAELMLGQCDGESPRGDRTVISKLNSQVLSKLLNRWEQLNSGQTGASVASLNQVALQTSGGTADAATADAANVQPANAEAANAGTASGKPTASNTSPPLTPEALKIVDLALEDFDQAISLNANALDAYRDRAEALRLKRQFDEAEQSATTACRLCYYRQARSLRTLAQICEQSGRHESAASYALHAAELASGAERDRYLYLWSYYAQGASGQTAQLASQVVMASQASGLVRGGPDTGNEDSTRPQPPLRMELPPGFISLSGTATP